MVILPAMLHSLWPLALLLCHIWQASAMATNSYGDSSYFSKPAIFNAKKDKIFKIGGMFPQSLDVSDFFSSEGIQETIAFVCGVNYINRNISIIPNLTLIYEDIDPIFSDTGAITSCISYILKKDVTLVLGNPMTVYFKALDLHSNLH